jgi:hypothetical protein
MSGRAGAAAHAASVIGAEHGSGCTRRRRTRRHGARTSPPRGRKEQHDDGSGPLGKDLPRGIQTVDAGQVHVHEDEIGLQLARPVDRILARLRLAGDLEPLGRLDDHPSRHPERLLIVDDEHPYGHAGMHLHDLLSHRTRPLTVVPAPLPENGTGRGKNPRGPR